MCEWKKALSGYDVKDKDSLFRWICWGALFFFPSFWITDGQLHISRPENRGVSLKDNSAPALPVRGPPTCISLTAGQPCKTFFWYGTRWKSKNCYFDRRSTPSFQVGASGSWPKLKRLFGNNLDKGSAAQIVSRYLFDRRRWLIVFVWDRGAESAF